MSQESMQETFERMVESGEWLSEEEKSNFIFTHYTGNRGMYELQLTRDEEVLGFFCLTNIEILPDRRQHIDSFLNRINFSTMFGHFVRREDSCEIDMHYAHALDVSRSQPQEEFISKVFGTMISDCETWHDQFILVGQALLNADELSLFNLIPEGEA